jgi:hypothetical protein
MMIIMIMITLMGVRLRLWTAATNWPTVHPPGDTWTQRNMVEWCRQRKTPFPSPTALWQSYQQSYLVASRWNGRREWWIWPCEVFLFILASDFLHAVKSYDMGPTALLLLRRKVCCGFLSIALAGFEPANRWSDGKHANHYTTEATFTQLKTHVGNRNNVVLTILLEISSRIASRCVSDRLWNTLYVLKMNGPTHSADNTHSHALGA